MLLFQPYMTVLFIYICILMMLEKYKYALSKDAVMKFVTADVCCTICKLRYGVHSIISLCTSLDHRLPPSPG